MHQEPTGRTRFERPPKAHGAKRIEGFARIGLFGKGERRPLGSDRLLEQLRVMLLNGAHMRDQHLGKSIAPLEAGEFGEGMMEREVETVR